MAIRSKVGLEAEFFLINEKGELIVPPSHWDRDGFPLLGEIRGKEGKNVPETITNFKSREMEIGEILSEGHTIRMANRERIPLKLYRKANKQVKQADKDGQLDAVKSIYGTDITEFSDQIIEQSKIKSAFGMKIQGIWASCGLHVHFSCGEEINYTYEEPRYEQVILPVGLGESGVMVAQHHELDEDHTPLDFTPAELLAKEMLKPCLYLYRHAGYNKDKKMELYASRLNKPAIEYIVKQMDEQFFERFAPKEAERTKYRQPGFFELKPYGFEYRSLPANARTMEALPEIARKAFDLLEEVNKY